MSNATLTKPDTIPEEMDVFDPNKPATSANIVPDWMWDVVVERRTERDRRARQ